MKYTETPPTIDAFQWVKGRESEVIEQMFGLGLYVRHADQILYIFNARYHGHVLDPNLAAGYGDYIVIHPSWDVEILSENIFNRLYTPVLEDIPVPEQQTSHITVDLSKLSQ